MHFSKTLVMHQHRLITIIDAFMCTGVLAPVVICATCSGFPFGRVVFAARVYVKVVKMFSEFASLSSILHVLK